MTREEAIKWIEYHIDISDYDEDDDLLTALKMAVKALKKQPKPMPEAYKTEDE